MHTTDYASPWPLESFNTADSITINGYRLLSLEGERRCLSQFLQPHIWLIQLLEIVISILSILLNSVSSVATFYSNTIPFSLRQTFAIISLNYAFLAAICLAKKCFLLLSIYYPCISVVSTLTCKLQEFPTLLIYLHSAILPLTLAAQMFCFRQSAANKGFDGRRVRKSCRNCDEFAVGTFDWTRCCSIHETLVLIFCVCFALYFTAFDADFGSKFLKKCSILIAIKERSTAFLLVTLLIFLHIISAVLWQLLAIAAGRFFKLSGELPKPSLYNEPASLPLKLSLINDMTRLCKVASSRRYVRVKDANKLPAIAEESVMSPILQMKNEPIEPRLMEPLTRHFVHVGEWRSPRALNAADDTKFRQQTMLSYLKLSFRDVLLYESIFWMISLIFAGSALVWQFVARGVCSKCIAFVVELSFTFFPLLITLSHALLCMWLVLPIRRATMRIFPTFIGSMLPSIEPKTPPLPRHSGTSPLHSDATSSSKSSINIPVKILVTRYDGGGSSSSTNSILSGRTHA